MTGRFVRNCIDLSTDEGYQFEFLCDRCGSGYLAPIQPAAVDLLSGALRTARSLLSAVAGAAQADGQAHAPVREKALAGAIEEARRHFHECGRCGQWVDAACWNEGPGLCMDCEPA